MALLLGISLWNQRLFWHICCYCCCSCFYFHFYFFYWKMYVISTVNSLVKNKLTFLLIYLLTYLLTFTYIFLLITYLLLYWFIYLFSYLCAAISIKTYLTDISEKKNHRETPKWPKWLTNLDQKVIKLRKTIAHINVVLECKRSNNFTHHQLKVR